MSRDVANEPAVYLSTLMARRLRERKIDNIVATGATCVVVGNPGCALQIRAGLAGRGLDVRVAHPVELLDEAYG